MVLSYRLGLDCIRSASFATFNHFVRECNRSRRTRCGLLRCTGHAGRRPWSCDLIASAQAFWRRSGIASDLIDYAALGGDFNSSDLTDGAKPMWHNDSKHLTLLRRIAVQQERVISRGGCLCGGVRYSVRGALRDIIACHLSLIHI